LPLRRATGLLVRIEDLVDDPFEVGFTGLDLGALTVLETSS